MNCKDRIKYLMFKLGIRETVPAGAINAVKIEETQEPLIDIRKYPEFSFSQKLAQQKNIFVRASVAERLKAVAVSLPEGIRLKIYSAHRDLDEQNIMWNDRLEKNRKKFPNISETELERLTRAQIAKPGQGFGGHQTGGAVDVTLCDRQDHDLNMGTQISEHNDQTKTMAYGLTDNQKRYRLILKKTMENQGFKNYPAEWWHFSYGDRLWAAYSLKKQCPYGLINKKGDRE